LTRRHPSLMHFSTAAVHFFFILCYYPSTDYLAPAEQGR
jgi:hypothetical protein